MKVFILFVLFAGSYCLPTNSANGDKRDERDNPGMIQSQDEPDLLRRDNRNIDYQAEDRQNYFPDYYYCDDGNEVTVTAKFWYVNDFDGGQENAEAVIDLFVATTNEALSNSKIPITYQKWGSVQQHPMTNDELASVKLGTYPDEDGNYITSNSVFAGRLGTDVEDYAFLRQTADHVVLLYNNLVNEPNRCWGFRSNMGTGSESWSTIWTIVVNGNLDDDSALIFAHEAGHCMGAMHNIEESTHNGNEFNYGYCIPGTTYSTVMAYDETCPEGGSYSRIPYYSNPDVYYEGYATGIPEANNALEMTLNKYDYSTAGPNCADGTATDKTEVINQCTWGDGWNEQPTTQCCCEGNLYALWWKYWTSPSCAMDVPGYTNVQVDYGHKVGVKLKDCINLLGELITPYETCALGDELKSEHDWREVLDFECDCDDTCVVEYDDVDGGWTDWGKCNQYCGGGTQMRTCSNPPRSGSGADCEGDAIQPCGEDACPDSGSTVKTASNC